METIFLRIPPTSYTNLYFLAPFSVWFNTRPLSSGLHTSLAPCPLSLSHQGRLMHPTYNAEK